MKAELTIDKINATLSSPEEYYLSDVNGVRLEDVNGVKLKASSKGNTLSAHITVSGLTATLGGNNGRL